MLNILSFAKQQLQPLDTGNLDAEILLAHVLQKPRSYLRAYPETVLTESQLTHFKNLIAQRAKKIPVAYLTGEKEFWSLPFKVTPDVLIPRPETELLVERILEDYAAREDLTLIDVGTGSGAIAIALAHEKPSWKIIASDISEAALVIARENKIRLSPCGTNRQESRFGQRGAMLARDTMSRVTGSREAAVRGEIVFLQSHYFNQFPPDLRADVIVSNPPYLAANDPHLTDTEISHEPRLALVAEENGLTAFQTIAQQAKKFLNPHGRLYFEHGCEQAKAVQAILQAAGYENIQTLQDLSGLPRLSYGVRPISNTTADYPDKQQ